MMIKVIRVPNKLLPCIKSAFIGTYCIMKLLYMYMSVNDERFEGYYTALNTQLGSFVAKKPIELLCINVMKISKEDILGLIDAFSKFSQAFVTTNLKMITIAKIFMDKWFYMYGILAQIHSDEAQIFENDIMKHNHCTR